VAVTMIAIAWSSKQRKERNLHGGIPVLVSGIAFLCAPRPNPTLTTARAERVVARPCVASLRACRAFGGATSCARRALRCLCRAGSLSLHGQPEGAARVASLGGGLWSLYRIAACGLHLHFPAAAAAGKWRGQPHAGRGCMRQ